MQWLNFSKTKYFKNIYNIFNIVFSRFRSQEAPSPPFDSSIIWGIFYVPPRRFVRCSNGAEYPVRGKNNDGPPRSVTTPAQNPPNRMARISKHLILRGHLMEKHRSPRTAGCRARCAWEKEIVKSMLLLVLIGLSCTPWSWTQDAADGETAIRIFFVSFIVSI